MKTIYSFLLLTIAFFFYLPPVHAQKELPEEQRQVYYLYGQFGIAHEPRMKVVVISSHLYRYKYNDDSHGRIETRLKNGFSAKMKRISQDEYHPEARSGKQIHETELKLNFAYLSSGIAKATGPETYLTLHSATKLLTASREKLLEEFLADGFAVYQTDFEDWMDESMSSLGLEKIEQLSTLWIPQYRKGNLLAIGKQYQGFDKAESKPSTTKKSVASEKGERNAAAEAAVKRWDAGLYEAEGDRLLKNGDLTGAAAQYRAAQSTMYTDRAQQKLNDVENTMNLTVAAIGGALDLAGDISYAMDDVKIPKFSAWGFSHHGLSLSGENKDLAPSLRPSSTNLTYGGYRIFALELGISLVKSPVYTMYLTDGQGRKNNTTIQVNRTTLGPTFSVGLALPFKYFVIYGMYGWTVPFWVTEANLLTQGYVYKEMSTDLSNMYFEPKTDVGIKLKIPGTRIGLGAHYMMNKHIGNKIKLKSNGYSIISKGSTEYFVGGSERDTYKYEVFGFSLYYLTKR